MRKVYLIPNLLTTGNMFCGFYSMISAMNQDYLTAAWAILIAGVFDMLDGRIARLAKATSQFGVEYDSLSDLISFGVAPSILLYKWQLEPFQRLGWLAAFLFLTCGALRLARFNVNSGAAPKNYFQGLPIPIAAGVVATFVLFQAEHWPSAAAELKDFFVLLLTFGLSSLMVSSLRFPSFKDLNWRSRASFGYFLVGILFMILVAARPEIALFLLMGSYVICSLLWDVTVTILKKSKRDAFRSDIEQTH